MNKQTKRAKTSRTVSVAAIGPVDFWKSRSFHGILAKGTQRTTPTPTATAVAHFSTTAGEGWRAGIEGVLHQALRNVLSGEDLPH